MAKISKINKYLDLTSVRRYIFNGAFNITQMSNRSKSKHDLYFLVKIGIGFHGNPKTHCSLGMSYIAQLVLLDELENILQLCWNIDPAKFIEP